MRLALVSRNRSISYHCSKAHRDLPLPAVHLFLAHLQLFHKLLPLLLYRLFTIHQHFSQAFQPDLSISALSPHPLEITKLAVISVPLPPTFNPSDLPYPCPQPVSRRSCVGCQVSQHLVTPLQLLPLYPNFRSFQPVCL